MNLEDAWNWLGRNYAPVGTIGAILLILNIMGFNINLPAFYASLNTDSKIMFFSAVNILFTIIVFLFALKRIKKSNYFFHS